jgi:hypothetical protein
MVSISMPEKPKAESPKQKRNNIKQQGFFQTLPPPHPITYPPPTEINYSLGTSRKRPKKQVFVLRSSAI